MQTRFSCLITAVSSSAEPTNNCLRLVGNTRGCANKVCSNRASRRSLDVSAFDQPRRSPSVSEIRLVLPVLDFELEICLGFEFWELEIIAHGNRIASDQSQSRVPDYRPGRISRPSSRWPGPAGLSFTGDFD